jgi:molybdopterin synthase catalytic subunit
MAVSFPFCQGPIVQGSTCARNQQDQQIGAMAVFTGFVRNDSIGTQQVVSIEFSSHEQIAHKACIDLMEYFLDKFRLFSIKILHSLGTVPTGEACFHIEVLAAHRKEAFIALAEVADSFKRKIPIFGKEILNTGDYVWKKNRY